MTGEASSSFRDLTHADLLVRIRAVLQFVSRTRTSVTGQFTHPLFERWTETTNGCCSGECDDTTHRSGALDHVIVVLFENRSLDNMLGHLYGPDDGKTFEGVIGKDLSNPIPDWAEHGAERKVVPYTVATDMDSPNPDSGEEWYHTNTQLFNVLDEHNRFKIGEAVTEPWNAPPAGATPTMDGFVTDYISTFTGEVGRQPTYEEYAQIMTGYTPKQLPVLNGIAREFGVFDHWFSEVPSQTFMNRSFWTAATSSGIVVNSPVKKWFTMDDAETIFERL
ncbi:MAG: hypothetical protein IH933_09780, partial [Euryarchaeota archaeon]|nr:hypothetical protein [Euryarchaeota archaeon]